MGSSSSKSAEPRRRLTKNAPSSQNEDVTVESLPASPPLDRYGPQPRPRKASAAVDKQTGERKDYTEMLHSLNPEDVLNPLSEIPRLRRSDDTPKNGHQLFVRLPPDGWERILLQLQLSDVASLAFSCKTLQNFLGGEALEDLNLPEYHQNKVEFLTRLDQQFPSHLLCPICAQFHFRTQKGEESLKPADVFNPLFNCPNAKDQLRKAPRTHITPGPVRRTLPFTFVQLATRAHRFGSWYGISTDSLSRRWRDRDSGWSHQSRFCIENGHLLMRITSQCFATPGLPASGLRHLLYSREDFTPYFSVCAHWRDGLLMPLVKCVLGHIPVPPKWVDQRLKQAVQNHVQHRQNAIVSLCGECAPMRRCPECPTEYLFELKLAEDKSDPLHTFRQALVVTRWSDLGDGSTPWNAEWAACNGDAQLDSFKAVGRRAIAGTFESHFTAEAIPGQRILSLNPKNEKKGEKGHDWY
ncbi:MAG: hypothetical protein Q9227_005220 [Pyrenula ochraceoflavens]